MSNSLSQILSDGTLLDNTIHRAVDGAFHVGPSREPVEIRKGGRKSNHPWAVWPLMQKAANLPLDESALVFRGTDLDYEHNTGDPFIQLEGFDPLNFTLTTGNLIGCVKSDDYTIRISSRFGDEFLKYIVADADGFLELPDLGGMDRGNYEWLLIYLWLIKLKKAFRLGLPKEYETRSESLAHVRGRLEPVSYFLNRDRATYRCTYREHSYDNPATRLIARTLQHLDSQSFIQQSHQLSQTFQIATQGRRASLQSLLSTAPVRNPYYMDYNPVISLSKQILRGELADAGSKSDTSAFLFDVSMLFEYFVRKMLKRAGAVFHEKSARRWNVPTGLRAGKTRRNLIPDLVFEVDGGTYVFDVKYKSFDFAWGVSREDIFQIHTYIGQVSNEQNVAGCGLIYPVRECRWNNHGLEMEQGVFSETIKQGGRSIPFHVAFVKVPEQEDASEGENPQNFRQQFQVSTGEFVRHFFEALQKGKRMIYRKSHDAGDPMRASMLKDHPIAV
jgi:5-methylcytosine-specific restriction enzyme subunit McrC